VIDLDGQVGMDSIRALEAIHGELPKTMMAFSGRGDGLHLFFKAPADAAGSRSPLAPSALASIRAAMVVTL